MTQLDETGLWQTWPPRRDQCAICGSEAGPFRFEMRPTGTNFKRQRWAYCLRDYRAYVLTNGNGEFSEALSYLLTAIFMGPEKVVDNAEGLGAG